MLQRDKSKDVPPKTGIKTLVRRAYKNRYGFDRVRIDKNGNITANYSKGSLFNLGHISECFTARSDAMNVRLYNRPHNLVFTFPFDV